MANKLWLKSVGFVVITILWHASYALDDAEFNKKFEEMAAEQGITDEDQINQLKLKLKAILDTKERFTYMALQTPCEEDIKRFCKLGASISEILQCMKDNRDQVTSMCGEALRNQFGSKPLNEAQIYHGVKIPKGSTFFYDPQGNILGAIASDEFVHNSIRFKKGQVRFHEEGISVAHLASDQFIDGIKYSADGIGPFFDKDGNVENATLAEDTQINGVLYKGGAGIMFYSPGEVRTGTVAQEIILSGETLEAGMPVWFNNDGSLRRR
jgi:hypothetical protein